MATRSTIQAMIRAARSIITIITLTARHLIDLSSPNIITKKYNGRVIASLFWHYPIYYTLLTQILCLWSEERLPVTNCCMWLMETIILWMEIFSKCSTMVLEDNNEWDAVLTLVWPIINICNIISIFCVIFTTMRIVAELNEIHPYHYKNRHTVLILLVD